MFGKHVDSTQELIPRRHSHKDQPVHFDPRDAHVPRCRLEPGMV